MRREEGPRQDVSAWLEEELTEEMEEMLAEQLGEGARGVSESPWEKAVTRGTDVERSGRLKTVECPLDLGKWNHW